MSSSPTPDTAGLDAFIHTIVDNWRSAPLSDAVVTLAEYAEKLTREPRACGSSDLEQLRGAGWCDVSIHDSVQVVAYFNYVNRVAEALGVEVEPAQPLWGRTMDS